jgi:SHS2 domain-containing protein
VTGPSKEGRHSFAEHTGEVELRLEAPSLVALFEEAARALAEVMAGRDVPGPEGPIEQVDVAGSDREALLADWLNEIVYRSEVNKRVYADVHVRELSDVRLRAEVRGFEPEALKTPVKAATLHRLHIEQKPDGFLGTVVLDV